MCHSAETALLRVANDLLLTADCGNPMVMVLLDLTAAPDLVDHNILLSHFDLCLGIKGTALKWFQSDLSDRKFSVHLDQFSSAVSPLHCGVPRAPFWVPFSCLYICFPWDPSFRSTTAPFIV